MRPALKPLRLHLISFYFGEIKAGRKLVEYRLADRWEKRLEGRSFSEVLVCRGYPRNGDRERILRREWRGYSIETITHEHFGPLPVRVLAIDVSVPVMD